MPASVFEPSVFEQVRSAERLLGEVAAEFDADALDVEGAKKLVDLFTRCERFAVAGRSLAAGRVARGVNWKHSGHRNSAEWLASATGVSVGEAGRELETARKLEELPETAKAFRSGELSEAQASEIAASASVDPASEERLLDTVREGATFRTVRDQCRETTMRASDDAARTRRLHDTRSAHTYTDTDGHLVLHAALAPDLGARVRSVIEKKTDELFRLARAAGRTELRSAYMADAVADAASSARPPQHHPTSGSTSTKHHWRAAGPNPANAATSKASAPSPSPSPDRCSRTRGSSRSATTNTATSPPSRHRREPSPPRCTAGSKPPTPPAAPPAATAPSTSRSTTSSPSKPAASPKKPTSGGSAATTTTSKPTAAGTSPTTTTATPTSSHPTTPTHHRNDRRRADTGVWQADHARDGGGCRPCGVVAQSVRGNSSTDLGSPPWGIRSVGAVRVSTAWWRRQTPSGRARSASHEHHGRWQGRTA